MQKIHTERELIDEYPWLFELLSHSPQEALLMAYRTGRLDGGLAVMDRQAMAKDIDEFRESQPVRGRA